MEDLCGVPKIHTMTWVAVVSTYGAEDQRVCRHMFSHSVVDKFTCLTNIYLSTGLAVDDVYGACGLLASW